MIGTLPHPFPDRKQTMNTPDNITCFSTACAAVLGELHAAFPRPVDLNAVEMQAALVAAGRLPAACAWVDEARDTCLVGATLDYLLAEGVVRCGAGPYPPIYPACVLSARGFAALQSPASLTGAAPAGDSLGKTLSTAGKMTASSAINQAVALLFQILSRP